MNSILSRQLLVLLLLLSHAAWGEEPIRGAFGIMLGSSIESNKPYISNQSEFLEHISLQFDPPIKNKSFLSYTGMATRDTKKIYQIQGKNLIRGKNKCFEAFDAYETSLINKYGKNIVDEAEKKNESGMLVKFLALEDKQSNMVTLRCYEWSEEEKSFWESYDDVQFILEIQYVWLSEFVRISKKEDRWPESNSSMDTSGI